MRILLLVVTLFAGKALLAQNKPVGKWQPVYLSMDKIIVADI